MIQFRQQKKKYKRIDLRFLDLYILMIITLSLIFIPNISGDTYGTLDSGLWTDGTYLYGGFENNVLPNVTGTTWSIDDTSFINGTYCLNYTKNTGYARIYADVGIRPSKYSISFKTKILPTSTIQIKFQEETPSDTFMLIIYTNLSICLYNSNPVYTSWFTIKFDNNMIYKLNFTNIDWDNYIFDVTLSNSTDSSTINDFSFDQTTNDFYFFRIICIYSSDPIYFDDITMGSQCIIQLDNIIVDDTESANFTGTFINDGSSYQNCSQQNNYDSYLLYDTISHGSNFSLYDSQILYEDEFCANTTNTDLFTFYENFLPRLYYYRLYLSNFNQTNSSSYYYTDENYFLAIPDAPVFIDCDVVNSTTISLVWSKASSSNRTILVMNTNNKPVSVTDGTIIYNGTGENLVYTVPGEGFYIRAWSYVSWTNPNLYQYSISYEDFTLNGLYINVYNELTLNAENNYKILISNLDGTETFYADECENTYFVNPDDCPTGNVQIIISQDYDEYYPRTYIIDMYEGMFNIFNAFIPPINISLGEGGMLPISHLYYLQTIDVANRPVENALMNIKRYSSENETWVTVSSGYTDANGYFNVYLISGLYGGFYKVFINKSGYYETISDYIPDDDFYGVYYPKVFKIFMLNVTINESMFYDIITFNGYLNNATAILYINYSDSLSNTISSNLVVIEINYSSNATNVIGTYAGGISSSYQYNITDVNTSCCYSIILYLNHTVFGYQKQSILTCGNLPHMGITTGVKFNLLFNIIFGTSPAGIGWTNFLGFIIIISCLFSFGERDCGISCVLCGFILLFVNNVIGLSFMGITIPVLFIIVGVLIEWRIKMLMGGG